jgi:hypothetical protein
LSKRSDIPERLIYTCRCGWIDKGHLDSTTYHPFIGARALWEQMLQEKGDLQKNGFKGFPVLFKEQEALPVKIFGQRMRLLPHGPERLYIVRRGLNRREKQQVALAIFIEVSYAFEDMQGSFPENLATDSGFSEEDLVSDLIGFYLTVRPDLDWESLCVPVSEKASLAVWDANGPVGKHKNRTFNPNYYPCAECKNKLPGLPSEFKAIIPAEKGEFFREFDMLQEALQQPAAY